MKKHRFIIVGSGWRSLYYVRIAKALPDRFELCAMLCRTEEKAELMSKEHDIYTTTSIDECVKMQPDFVVVAVNKTSIADVSMEWMNRGFTVLCETPAALDIETLQELWRLHMSGKRLVVAEQYIYYPTYQAMLEVLKTNLIGEPNYLSLSVAHEYHGASLMREFLRENVSTQFRIVAKTYAFPTVETLSRYERFTDGRIADKKRTVATFEFDDGKVALYDFDSEQYRSPIRNKFIKLQGSRGEMKDNTFYYLDEMYEPQQSELLVKERWLATTDTNPNRQRICEIENVILRSRGVTKESENTSITYDNSVTEQIVYQAVFGLCGLTEDETAIAQMMLQAAEYNRECEDKALRNALQDSYMAILMKQAVETGVQVASEKQIWQEGC